MHVVDGALVGLPARDDETWTFRRMAVAWQHPTSRGMEPVGLLEYDGRRYRFRYLERALSIIGFRPFLGFPTFARDYTSDYLFPIFAQRVMDAKRPDFARHVASLDLSAKDASPWEQLARTEGRRAGDTIQLFPEPQVSSNGLTECRFLVHGIRHCLPDENDRDRLLASLKSGTKLSLIDEPDNPKNRRAILTSTLSGEHIGWVPNLLVEYVHHVREHGSVDVRVVHRNGPSAPIHLRLLVKLEGYAGPGYRPFSGDAWKTIEG